jgi:hypothetical protein
LGPCAFGDHDCDADVKLTQRPISSDPERCHWNRFWAPDGGPAWWVCPKSVASDLAADAAAWALFAMYWCVANHPAALFNKSLHPPTGLVRWISQFHVAQQRTQVREIQGQFAHYLGVTRDRCDVLVRRMMKRTGSVALLRALCEF